MLERTGDFDAVHASEILNRRARLEERIQLELERISFLHEAHCRMLVCVDVENHSLV